MKTEKATIIKFQYAGFEFNGLVLPNGTRALALPQVFNLISVPQKNAVRELKALLGNDLTLPQKIKTEVHNRLLNVVTLEEFSLIIIRAAVKGNQTAQKIAEASVQTTIDIAFDAALGIERTTREYQADLEARVESKKTRRSLTDSWQYCYELTGAFPAYGRHTLELYEILELSETYEQYCQEYNKYQRSKFTFRHDYLPQSDRAKIQQAEDRIRYYIEDFDMSVEDALAKLKESLAKDKLRKQSKTGV